MEGSQRESKRKTRERRWEKGRVVRRGLDRHAYDRIRNEGVYIIANIPGYEQIFKAKMENLVDIKRGVEIAEFELIAARIVTEEWIKEVYERQQKKSEEREPQKPDTVYKNLYGTRGKAEWGESLKIKEGVRHAGYWPENEEQGEAANG